MHVTFSAVYHTCTCMHVFVVKILLSQVLKERTYFAWNILTQIFHGWKRRKLRYLLPCTFLFDACMIYLSQAAPPPTSVGSDNKTVSYISCDQGLLTTGILPDALVLVSYVWAWIVFRKMEPEHLSALIATVSALSSHVLRDSSQ